MIGDGREHHVHPPPSHPIPSHRATLPFFSHPVARRHLVLCPSARRPSSRDTRRNRTRPTSIVSFVTSSSPSSEEEQEEEEEQEDLPRRSGSMAGKTSPIFPSDAGHRRERGAVASQACETCRTRCVEPPLPPPPPAGHGADAPPPGKPNVMRHGRRVCCSMRDGTPPPRPMGRVLTSPSPQVASVVDSTWTVPIGSPCPPSQSARSPADACIVRLTRRAQEG